MNISDEQLKKIFELASMEDTFKPSEITEKDVSVALIEIERKLYSFLATMKTDSLEDKKILIADDLELSVYQLTTVLKRIGITPYVARHKDEALSEIQKVHFDCIIIDLFIPDSSDGLDLIRSAVQRRKETGNDTKIVVISGNDDSSLIEQCYEAEIDLYIQKDVNWHTSLLKYLGNTFRSEKNIFFDRYIINDEIVAYSIKRFNDGKIFNLLLKDINSSLVTDSKHILLDLRAVSTFDTDNVYIFADIFKICAENGVKFIVLNPSSDIKQALAFAYLDGIIPVFNSVEDALSEIKKDRDTAQ